MAQAAAQMQGMEWLKGIGPVPVFWPDAAFPGTGLPEKVSWL
jgi:hypothetical protein